MKTIPHLLSLLALTILAAGTAGAQTYDFNAGSDADLIRYDPLAGLGLGGTYGFPGGDRYRVQAASSVPLTGTVGPGRAGALGSDPQADFSVSVDLVDWDPALDQAIGLVGRIQQPGLGMSDGYGFLYFPAGGGVAFNRFDDEASTVLPSAGSPLVTLDPAKDYRLVFTGVGPVLTGSIFDLAAPETPLVSITANDATYASGAGGLLVSAALSSPGGTGDATFDNLRVAVPEPHAPLLLLLGAGCLHALRRRSPARVSPAGSGQP
jgi:hypothetical protein